MAQGLVFQLCHVLAMIIHTSAWENSKLGFKLLQVEAIEGIRRGPIAKEGK